jgi:arabinan endo-1,5-alpha-L-arabinosidase
MRPSTEAEVPLFGDEAGITEKILEKDAYLINNIDNGAYFRIDSPDSNPFYWKLYNVEGRMVLNGESITMAIVDASAMQRGLYVLKVNGAAGDFCGKVLRQ